MAKIKIEFECAMPSSYLDERFEHQHAQAIIGAALQDYARIHKGTFGEIANALYDAMYNNPKSVTNLVFAPEPTIIHRCR